MPHVKLPEASDPKKATSYEELVDVMDARLRVFDVLANFGGLINDLPSRLEDDSHGRATLQASEDLQDILYGKGSTNITLPTIQTIENNIQASFTQSLVIHAEWRFLVAHEDAKGVTCCLVEQATGNILAMPVFSTFPSLLEIFYSILTVAKELKGFPERVGKFPIQGELRELSEVLREFVHSYTENREVSMLNLSKILDQPDWHASACAIIVEKHWSSSYLRGRKDLNEAGHCGTSCEKAVGNLLDRWLQANDLRELYNLQPVSCVLLHQNIQRERLLASDVEHQVDSRLTPVDDAVIEDMILAMRERYGRYLYGGLFHDEALLVCSEFRDGDYTGKLGDSDIYAKMLYTLAGRCSQLLSS